MLEGSLGGFFSPFLGWMHLVSISCVSVVSEGRAGGGTLLYFSSLHLCRISKLLWWTGWWRKLKLSTLFKTAHGTASSCPWEAKWKQNRKLRDEKDYTKQKSGEGKEQARRTRELEGHVFFGAWHNLTLGSSGHGAMAQEQWAGPHPNPAYNPL